MHFRGTNFCSLGIFFSHLMIAGDKHFSIPKRVLCWEISRIPIIFLWAYRDVFENASAVVVLTECSTHALYTRCSHRIHAMCVQKSQSKPLGCLAFCIKRKQQFNINENSSCKLRKDCQSSKFFIYLSLKHTPLSSCKHLF